MVKAGSSNELWVFPEGRGNTDWRKWGCFEKADQTINSIDQYNNIYSDSEKIYISFRLDETEGAVKTVFVKDELWQNVDFINELIALNVSTEIVLSFLPESFKENNDDFKNEIHRISEISLEMCSVKSLLDFERLIEEHEQIIASIIKLKPVKELLFPDYLGAIKSLGAWGGDFVLVTGNKSTLQYFKEKGYETILSYSNMVLWCGFGSAQLLLKFNFWKLSGVEAIDNKTDKWKK